MIESTGLVSLDEKNLVNENIYNALAGEYKLRDKGELCITQMQHKANILKWLCKNTKALEIWVGGGMFNRILSDYGFNTTGIDIAENMLRNLKSINPVAKIIHADFISYSFKNKFDLIVWLAFIHLFEDHEAHLILTKMKRICNKQLIVHLTTTKEGKKESWLFEKRDYDVNPVRFRTKHTPESFINLGIQSWMKLVSYEEEEWAHWKTWMSISLRNE